MNHPFLKLFLPTLSMAISLLAIPQAATSQGNPQDASQKSEAAFSPDDPQAVPPGSEAVMPRNPFALPDGVLLKSQIKEVKPEKTEKIPELVLEAIMIGKTHRIATINNKNFNEGSQVYDKKLVKIRKNEVILDDGGDQLTLTLNRLPFPIDVKR